MITLAELDNKFDEGELTHIELAIWWLADANSQIQALEELSALRSEIERLKAEREWQPIESCSDLSSVLIGKYLSGNWYTTPFNCYHIEWKYGTHWMPLPQPPEEK